MPSRLLKIGSYVFPNTFALVSHERVNVVPSGKLPRADGSRTIRGSSDATVLRIEGGLSISPIASRVSGVAVTNIRDAIDDMLEALKANTPDDFYPGWDDRYYPNVDLLRFPEENDVALHGKVAHISIDLIAPHSFQVSTTLTTDTWTPGGSGQTRVITVGGKTVTFPQFEFTVPSSGPKTIDYTLRNETYGETFTLSNIDTAANVNGGDVIIVDYETETVTIAGADRRDLFDGVFVSMRKGPNTMYEAYGATAISQIVTKYRNRWQ